MGVEDIGRAQPRVRLIKPGWYSLESYAEADGLRLVGLCDIDFEYEDQRRESLPSFVSSGPTIVEVGW